MVLSRGNGKGANLVMSAAVPDRQLTSPDRQLSCRLAQIGPAMHKQMEPAVNIPRKTLTTLIATGLILTATSVAATGASEPSVNRGAAKSAMVEQVRSGADGAKKHNAPVVSALDLDIDSAKARRAQLLKVHFQIARPE